MVIEDVEGIDVEVGVEITVGGEIIAMSVGGDGVGVSVQPEKIIIAPVITKNNIKRLKFLLPMLSHPVANCNHCSALRPIKRQYQYNSTSYSRTCPLNI